VANEWAEAYLAIRKCNEQSELKMTELRAKFQLRIEEQVTSMAPEVKQDFGPISYKGITFKDTKFPRFAAQNGSSIFFLELPLPLGLSLAERVLQPQDSAPARAVEVEGVLEGGSAFEDGRVQPGDLLRCITVPKRKVTSNEEVQEGEEPDTEFAVGLGLSAGDLTKALLVIPSTSSFPFERVLEEMQANRNADNRVGMVFERPL